MTEPDDCARIQADIQAAKDASPDEKRILIKRAIDAGCVDEIPDEWEMELP